jgi:hypothetical protein
MDRWNEICRHGASQGHLAGRLTMDANWYLNHDQLVGYGRKPSDYDATAFQGIHVRYVVIIIDEACGVPRSRYDAVDSLATNEGARVLAACFPEICQPGRGWNVIRVNPSRSTRRDTSPCSSRHRR